MTPPHPLHMHIPFIIDDNLHCFFPSHIWVHFLHNSRGWGRDTLQSNELCLPSGKLVWDVGRRVLVWRLLSSTAGFFAVKGSTRFLQYSPTRFFFL